LEARIPLTAKLALWQESVARRQMLQKSGQQHYDLIIIGTGAGGGTLAYALRNSGLKTLLIERGDFLPQEANNWNAVEVWKHQRYQTQERWLDSKNRPFRPMQHYFVGGNTKVYGAALPRFRVEDFEAVEHHGGISPAWPIRYQDLEPYYKQAEELYLVHGSDYGDPTAPPRSQPFPFAPITHEPYIQTFVERLKQQGLNPCSLPIGIDLREGGRCLFCSTCESYPCQVLAKGDADVCCVRPALESPTVEIMTQTAARRLLTDASGHKIVAVEVEQGGEIFKIHGDLFVVSCGAINSAALLLRSANDRHPNGLANSSGLVGRNFMGHNATFFVAFHLARANTSIFQKTWQLNDFYHRSSTFSYPMGNVQANGKWPIHVLFPIIFQGLIQKITERRYITLAALSEDLPDSENQIFLASNGQIKINYRANNVAPHKRLSQLVNQILRRSGYSFIISKESIYNSDKIAHQCGTLRFGNNPENSVLDPFCRTHDVQNLYCVDGGFFPSSSAQNPTLTIVAQALRVGEHLLAEHS
jgi:choline dehydrogenase-like flavoprotein